MIKKAYFVLILKHFVYILILSFLFLIGSCAQNQIGSNSEESISGNDPSVVSVDRLAGHWTCCKIFVDYNPEKTLLAMDADYEWKNGEGNLIFSGDSMWYFDYPREFHKRYQFKLEPEKILISEEGSDEWKSDKLVFSGDTLIRTIGGEYDVLYTEYYLRDTLDKGIVELLLRDSINVNELVGTWYLERMDSPVDGAEPSEFYFPFELPDSIVFKTEDIHSSRRINLDVNGKSREFRVGFMKDGWYGYQKIWLKPTNWYTGEELRIHYSL